MFCYFLILAQIQVQSKIYDDFEETANKQIFGTLSEENIERIRTALNQIDNVFKRINERDRTQKDKEQIKLFDIKLTQKMESLNKENQENTEKFIELKSKYKKSIDQIENSKNVSLKMTERENKALTIKMEIQNERQKIYDQEQEVNNMEYQRKEEFQDKEEFIKKMHEEIQELKEQQKGKKNIHFL